MRIPAQLRAKYLKEAVNNGMKVLTLDCETSHAIVRTFYIGTKVFIGHKQLKVPNKVITIQYKWMHEKKAKYLQWDKVDTKYDDSRNFDDSSMIEEFATNVLSQADIVIGQNLDSFDIKVLNERAKTLHLSIIDHKPSIDILKLSRKSFRCMSHKLDYRSEQQGLGGKISMEDQDWTDIEENNVPVTKKMVPYGLKDAVDTETLFLKKELLYYKDLPVNIERVVLSFISQETLNKDFPKKIKMMIKTKREIEKETTQEKRKLQCAGCRRRKRPSFNTYQTKKGKVTCANCLDVWYSK